MKFLQRFEIAGFAVRDGQRAAQNLQSFFSLGLDRELGLLGHTGGFQQRVDRRE
jgi:hypothetical protein